MTRIYDPFTQALETLRHSATTGAYTPGRPIVIVDEARRLKVSPTPVREALAWLCGEGLVERAPAGGFLAPGLNASVLRDRYAFRMHCLFVGLDLGGAWAEPGLGDSDLHQGFAGLVQSTGNIALAEAFSRVAGRLALVQAFEDELLGGGEIEAEKLRALSPGQGLRQAIKIYHERRMTAAPQLVSRILQRRPDAALEP